VKRHFEFKQRIAGSPAVFPSPSGRSLQVAIPLSGGRIEIYELDSGVLINTLENGGAVASDLASFEMGSRILLWATAYVPPASGSELPQHFARIYSPQVSEPLLNVKMTIVPTGDPAFLKLRNQWLAVDVMPRDPGAWLWRLGMFLE
jgi:hypothetical protein